MKRHSRRSGHAVQDSSFLETTMVSLDQRGVLIQELVTGFADLWKEETFCDVTIVCPEGKLRCHAAMLAALSPLLKVSLIYFYLFYAPSLKSKVLR